MKQYNMGKVIDITGQRFGRLVALEMVGRNSAMNVLWRCKCDCGNETTVSGSSLRKGVTKSCGCYKSESVIANNIRRSTGKCVNYEVPPDIAMNTPIDKDAFYDWWMFGEKEISNEKWFKALVV